jgi:hypothetical protein
MMAITARPLNIPIGQLFGTETFIGLCGQLLIASLGGGAIFLITAYLLKTEELNTYLESLRKKFLSDPNVPEEIIGE